MVAAARSLWHDTLASGDDSPARPPLDGDTEVDVALVGGGYGSLWTAYYLSLLDPARSVLVIEREVCGAGASGRNGGWASALLPMSLATVAAQAGRDRAVRLQRAMHATVDEIGRVAAAEGIDCHFTKGGTLTAATSPAHVARLQAEVRTTHSWGFDDLDHRWLDRREAAPVVNVAGALGATFTPHCAVVHPARLARGLAAAVERRGVRIVEGTTVQAIAPGRVHTDRGMVRAASIVRATEGFTPMLRSEHRTLAPLYSLMVATEPLPPAVWEELGWGGRATFTDGRHLLVYGQRTADGRIAFGGRGAPYHFGSRVRPAFDVDDGVHRALEAELRRLFPAIGDARITHRWGGPLAAARDWWCSVGYDPSSGLGWAGGYVGDGVSTTNLAGRTLAHLITGTDSELASLPWVGHRSRRWEPEPLRWLGINLALTLPAGADRHEARTGRPDRARTWLLGKLLT